MILSLSYSKYVWKNELGDLINAALCSELSYEVLKKQEDKMIHQVWVGIKLRSSKCQPSVLTTTPCHFNIEISDIIRCSRVLTSKLQIIIWYIISYINYTQLQWLLMGSHNILYYHSSTLLIQPWWLGGRVVDWWQSSLCYGGFKSPSSMVY